MDALLGLDPVQQPVQVLRGTEGFPVHAQQVVGDVDLAVIEPGQVAGVLPGDALPHDLALVQQRVEAPGQVLRLGAEQPLGGVHELGVGEENVAVVQVVAQGVQQPGLQAQGGVGGDAQGQGQLIHRGKGDIEGVLQE